MDYEEILQYLEDVGCSYGSRMGLGSIKELLRRLDNPQDKLNFIHVAGTNGKGSTIAFIESIIIETGYVVGKYTSPVTFTFRESIQIAGDYISRESVVKGIEEIRTAIVDMVKDGFEHPTRYEIETTLAFLYFYKMYCDIVILETGMGGLKDATNVIKSAGCIIITSISMDHMNILGDTIEQIAVEKAGIIKPNSTVVVYEQESKVYEVIFQKAIEENAILRNTDFNCIRNMEFELNRLVFSYKELEDIEIYLMGEHQIKNAVTAIEAAKVLIEQGHPLDNDIIKLGLKKAKWHGRFEIIKENPMFIIDGAHNVQGAKALYENILRYFKGQRIIYIIGVLADKDYENIILETASLAECILTITPDNKRALNSIKLTDVAKKYCNNVIDAKTISNAVEMSINMAKSTDDKNEGIIIAFGSLSYFKDIKIK